MTNTFSNHPRHTSNRFCKPSKGHIASSSASSCITSPPLFLGWQDGWSCMTCHSPKKGNRALNIYIGSHGTSWYIYHLLVAFVYLPTWFGWFLMVNHVGKYTGHMDPMGYAVDGFQLPCTGSLLPSLINLNWRDLTIYQPIVIRTCSWVSEGLCINRLGYFFFHQKFDGPFCF